MNQKEKLAIVKERIVGATYKVSNTLGRGFTPDIYTNAIAHELRKLNVPVITWHGIDVVYDGVVVGTFVADLLVDDQILVDITTDAELTKKHIAQSTNYLMATQMPMCLLISFGKVQPTIKRITNGL